MQNEVRLSTMQKEIYAWSTKNFGDKVDMYFDVSSFLGMVEEMGELAHAMLKLSQGIRGSKAEHLEDFKDAIGDILIYLLDFLERNSEQLDYVDADQILADVWSRVRVRDWRLNRVTGTAPQYETPTQEHLRTQLLDEIARGHKPASELDVLQSVEQAPGVSLEPLL